MGDENHFNSLVKMIAKAWVKVFHQSIVHMCVDTALVTVARPGLAFLRAKPRQQIHFVSLKSDIPMGHTLCPI